MNTMKNWLKNWNYMRILRLALGVLIITQGIIAADWVVTGMGALLSLLSLLNLGCCGASGCATGNFRSNKPTEEISFEEVK